MLLCNVGVSISELREAIFRTVFSLTRRGKITWRRKRNSFEQHPAFEANYRGVHIEISDNINKISFYVNGVEFPHIKTDALWASLDNAKPWDPRWEAEESEIILSVLQAP